MPRYVRREMSAKNAKKNRFDTEKTSYQMLSHHRARTVCDVSFLPQRRLGSARDHQGGQDGRR